MHRKGEQENLSHPPPPQEMEEAERLAAAAVDDDDEPMYPPAQVRQRGEEPTLVK